MEASEEEKLPESEVLAQVFFFASTKHGYYADAFLTSLCRCRAFPSLSARSYAIFTFQTRTMIFGAMDTTSNALSRILCLLAAHPEVQDRVRQEILDALLKNEGQDLSYDELISLPFLDAVCRETLRLWVR
jgi:cytochrome P450